MLASRPHKHTLFSAIGLSLCAVFALCAVQSTNPKTMTYHSAYRQTLPALGTARYEGTLILTFAKDGIVSGWYRDDYEINRIPVTGGFEGNELWFSIGLRGRDRFTGKIQATGEIVGTMSRWRGNLLGEFTAKPEK